LEKCFTHPSHHVTTPTAAAPPATIALLGLFLDDESPVLNDLDPRNTRWPQVTVEDRQTPVVSSGLLGDPTD